MEKQKSLAFSFVTTQLENHFMDTVRVSEIGESMQQFDGVETVDIRPEGGFHEIEKEGIFHNPAFQHLVIEIWLLLFLLPIVPVNLA